MLFDFALIIFGGALLYWGAEWLVAGAASLATSLGVSQLAVGLTVVSLGTSAPELVVSVVAAIQGQSALALANVVGSNIANIGLVLGLTTLVKPPEVDTGLFRREVPFLLVATLATGPVLLNGRIDRYEGVAFLAGAVAFTLGAFHRATTPALVASPPNPPPSAESHHQPHAELATGHDQPRGRAILILWTCLGIVTLILGGELFVRGATAVAQALGVSERVIGLTLVALGTSLPELAASLVAAFRGHTDLAIGNVVGSNILNILLILGAAAAVAPIHAQLRVVRLDLIVMTLFAGVLSASLCRKRHLSKAEGWLFVGGYSAFIGAVAACP